jgi:hypothetical protein
MVLVVVAVVLLFAVVVVVVVAAAGVAILDAAKIANVNRVATDATTM